MEDGENGLGQKKQANFIFVQYKYFRNKFGDRKLRKIFVLSI